MEVVRWKEKMEGQMSRLEQSIIQSTNQPSRITAWNAAPWQQLLSLDNAETERVNIQPNPQNNNISDTVTLNLSCSLGAFPASSMVSLTLRDMTTNLGQTWIQYPAKSYRKKQQRICSHTIKETLIPVYTTAPETWGSGYPSDSKCVGWLRRNMDPVFGWGNECRFSWGTAREMLELKGGARVDWPQN
jgi:hypothetical protein